MNLDLRTYDHVYVAGNCDLKQLLLYSNFLETQNIFINLCYINNSYFFLLKYTTIVSILQVNIDHKIKYPNI